MRERMGHKKCNLNNKGMSLVEVMVAVIIMALVTGPLLHAFVTATTFNMRAKERQRITSAAQSIMEGLKAYNLEDICKYFNNKAPFDLYAGVGSFGETTDINGDGVADPSVTTDVSGEDIFTPSPSNEYTFYLENIPYQGTFFDAQVKLSPSTAAGSTASVAEPPDMNAYMDAVYKQASYDDQNAYNQILDKVSAELYDLTNIHYNRSSIQTSYIYTTKNTEIQIYKSGSIDIVNVKNQYDYEVIDYPYMDAGVPKTFSKNDFDPIPMPDKKVYDNTNTISDGAKLEDVYIFYYPSYPYNISGITINHENILIKNNSGIDRKVYLIKQMNEAISHGSLTTCESAYTPNVSGSGNSIQLYHNLKVNLADPDSTTPAPIITGSNITAHSDILSFSTEVLVYNVEVSIYKQGEAVAGFTSSPLLTLDGSINDHKK